MENNWKLTIKDFFSSQYLHIIALGAVLLISSYLRLAYVVPDYSINDSQRDYLVASHILKYSEYPSVGPNLSIFSGLSITSPFYFYILAAVLAVHNSPETLQVFAIVLGLVASILTYFLAFLLFNKNVALLSAIFVALSNFGIGQSAYVMAPYVSQGFLLASFLFFAICLKGKSLVWLLPASALYACACALYSANFSIFPVIAWVVWYLTRRAHKKPFAWLSSSFTLWLAALAALYLPVFVYYFSSGTGQMWPSLAGKFSFSPSIFFSQFISAVSYLVGSFFYTTEKFFTSNYFNTIFRDAYPGSAWPTGVSAAMLIICLVIVLLLALNFFWQKKEKVQQNIFFVGACMVLSVLVAQSLLQFSYRAVWHFVPILSVCAIMMAVVCVYGFPKFKFSFLFKSAVIVFLFLVITVKPSVISLYQQSKAQSNESFLELTTAIKSKLAVLDAEQNQTASSNFEVEEYEPQALGFVTNPAIWTVLEPATHRHLITLSDQVYTKFGQLNQPRYVFLICKKLPIQACRDHFNYYYPAYSPLSQLLDNEQYVMFITEQNLQQ